MRKTELVEIRDFSGGLNYRTDHFQLFDNESPDLLNVDTDPRGGVRVRNGQKQDTVFTARTGALNLDWLAPWPARDEVLGFNSGNSVIFRPGAAVVTSATVTGVTDAVQFNDGMVLMRGTAFPALAATGSPPTLGNLTSFAFLDDYADPATPGIVSGYTVASHLSRVFVGRTFESAAEKPNRLRWSHPGRHGAFSTIDFVDVGDKGEYITALAPFGDQLAVFTNRSMHGLFGSAPSDFNVRPITRVIGVASPRCVAASPGKLYFWSDSEGVYSYDGTRIVYLFDKLRPALQSGRMEPLIGGQMQWADGKLYVPITLDQVRKTLVYDPSLNRGGGSWTLYDLNMKGIVAHSSVDGDVGVIYTRPDDVTDTRLYTLGDATYDDTINGVSTAITAHYHTRWFDVKLPAAVKQWRSPRVVVTSTAPHDIVMDVYHDYNFADLSKRLYVSTDARVDAALWGSFNWGEANWQGSGLMYDFDRTPRLGRSNAVQLRFSASLKQRWSIDSVTLVYQQKKVR